MPTQEERLANVESSLNQFKTETLRAYRDMAFEMTMVKGLCEDSVRRMLAMNQRLDRVDQRLDSIERSVNQRFDAQDQRLDGLDTKFDQVLGMLSTLVSGIRQDM